MDQMSLGDRMKERYENAYRFYLPGRMPVIIRVDGKAFHTLTKKYRKPYDGLFSRFMDAVAISLVGEIQGAEISYVQSDEVSVLVHNYKRFSSSAWFDNNLQKMASVSASIATAAFMKASGEMAHFDSRVFVLPPAEVNNYFLWRQQDATRNSILALAQSLYSHRELENRKTPELHELIHAKGKNWNDVPTRFKRGACATLEGGMDNEIPIFSEDPDYINNHLKVLEE